MANEIEIIVTDKYKSGGGFEAAEKGAKASGSKMLEIGKQAGMAAGAAIGGTLATGLQGAMNIESAQAKLAAQLGGSAEFAGEMGKVAGDLYSDAYGESLEQVNDAVRTVVQSGALMEDATNEQIKSITAQAMSMAQTFGVDVTEAMRAVGQMVRTGMVPDAQAGMDLITRAFQQLGPQAQDVLDTFNEYSGQFQKLGIDGKQALGMVSQMVKAGARDTDVAADAIKEFSIRAVDGSKASAEAFKLLGLDAVDMTAKFAQGGQTAQDAFQLVIDKLKGVTDPVKQNAAAVGLFGTQAEDLGAALLAIDPGTAVKALGEVDGAGQKLNDTLNDTAEAKVVAMQRSMEGMVASAMNLPGPLGSVATAIMAFGTTALSIVGPIGSVVAAYFTMSAAATASAATQATAQGVVQSSWIRSSAIAMASAVRISAAWVIAMGPVALIVAGVIAAFALLVGAIIWVVKHWDQIKMAVTIAMAVIRARVAEGVDWLVGKWNSFIGFFTGIKNKIVNIGHTMWDGIVSGAKAAVNIAVSGINKIIQAINALISGINRIPGVPNMSKIPHVPKLAHGGIAGGLAMVGEQGRELVRLPQGSHVRPHGTTEAMMRGSGGPADIRLTINSAGGRLNDLLVEILRKSIKDQGGNVQAVLGR